MLATVMRPEEELYWLALTLVPGLGTRRAGRLLERFGSPRALLEASRSELEAAGIDSGLAQSIASGCSFEDAATQQEKMRAAGAVVITLSDERYPPLLREIYDPSTVLFARGRVELLQRFMLAIVGTRRPTPYGIAVAERLGRELGEAGLTIVSGMARGIDTAAHTGALETEGGTVAVLGCGADVIYPSENRRLAGQIAEKGLILSEFPMGSVAFPQNFPIRNRIISGMSTGTLVVEGAQYSGSAITAKLAIDQGREVFAVPGNITSKASWGPNLLIKQGAKLVHEWQDVITELPLEVRSRLIEMGRQRILGGLEGGQPVFGEPQGSPSYEDPNAETTRRVMAVLKFDESIQLDKLLETVDGCSPSELIAALFELEMRGMVRQLPGKNFVKVW